MELIPGSKKTTPFVDRSGPVSMKGGTRFLIRGPAKKEREVETALQKGREIPRTVTQYNALATCARGPGSILIELAS